jgi:hypothetical protein
MLQSSGHSNRSLTSSFQSLKKALSSDRKINMDSSSKSPRTSCQRRGSIRSQLSSTRPLVLPQQQVHQHVCLAASVTQNFCSATVMMSQL